MINREFYTITITEIIVLPHIGSMNRFQQYSQFVFIRIQYDVAIRRFACGPLPGPTSECSPITKQVRTHPIG